jgi:hypothetical protein
LSQPDDFREFLARQAEAEEAIVYSDPEPRMRLWFEARPSKPTRGVGTGQIGMGRAERDLPLGGVPALARDLPQLPVGHRGRRRPWRHGYTVGLERFNHYTEDGRVEPITVRVTHVYRREDREMETNSGGRASGWGQMQKRGESRSRAADACSSSRASI